MPEVLKPTPNTAKRLYALSRNRCAFPGCPTPIIDPGTGANLGEIAHICGEKTGASRFDEKQTDEDRRAFENLVLVCATHHTLIDSDAGQKEFSVARLRRMKEDHEALSVPDAIADAILGHHALAKSDRDFVLSLFQSGGQTAHSITNNIVAAPSPVPPHQRLGLPGPHPEKGTEEWFRLQKILGMLRVCGVGHVGAFEAACVVEPKISQDWLDEMEASMLIENRFRDRSSRAYCATSSAIQKFMLNKWVVLAARFDSTGQAVVALEKHKGMWDFISYGDFLPWFRAIPLLIPGSRGRVFIGADAWD